MRTDPRGNEFWGEPWAHHTGKCKQSVAVTVSKQYLLLSLIVAGDISPNPGPQANYYCQVCEGQKIPGDVRTFCSYCQNWIHASCTNNWMCSLCSDSAPADNVYMFPTVLNGESQDSAWSTAAQTWNANSAQDVIGVDYLSDVSSTESSQASNSFLSLPENTSYSDETLEDCFQEIKLKRLEHPQNFLIAHLNINSIRQKFYELK